MNKLICLLFCYGISYSSENPPSEHASSGSSAKEPFDQGIVKEIMDLENQVTMLGAKIGAKETSVKDLIRQKQAEKDPEKVSEIIKLLQQEHRELNSLIKEYNTQYGLLQYRYPERGVTHERKYKRFSSQSLEDLEKSIGLEGYLHKSRKKIRKVYGVEGDGGHGKSAPGNLNSVKEKESILKPSTISK